MIYAKGKTPRPRPTHPARGRSRTARAGESVDSVQAVIYAKGGTLYVREQEFDIRGSGRSLRDKRTDYLRRKILIASYPLGGRSNGHSPHNRAIEKKQEERGGRGEGQRKFQGHDVDK